MAVRLDQRLPHPHEPAELPVHVFVDAAHEGEGERRGDAVVALDDVAVVPYPALAAARGGRGGVRGSGRRGAARACFVCRHERRDRPGLEHNEVGRGPAARDQCPLHILRGSEGVRERSCARRHAARLLVAQRRRVPQRFGNLLRARPPPGCRAKGAVLVGQRGGNHAAGAHAIGVGVELAAHEPLAQAVDRAHHRRDVRIHQLLDHHCHLDATAGARALRAVRGGARQERRGPHRAQRVPHLGLVARVHAEHGLELARERCARTVLRCGRRAHGDARPHEALRRETLEDLRAEGGRDLDGFHFGAAAVGVRLRGGPGRGPLRPAVERDGPHHDETRNPEVRTRGLEREQPGEMVPLSTQLADRRHGGGGLGHEYPLVRVHRPRLRTRKGSVPRAR